MRAALAQLRTSSFASSAFGHIALIVFAQFGLPFLFTPPPVTATVIPVDVVRIDDVTRPPEAATPEPEPETTREASPQPPPRPPQPVPEPPKPPEPQKVAKAEPAPPPVVAPPKPQEKAPEPEPEPEPEPAAKPETAKVQPKAKPKPPKPERGFENILKDLAAEETPRKTRERARKPETVAKKGDEAPQQSQVSELASIRERDLLGNMIREQVSPCWSPPPGARDADTLQVSLQISVDPQGNVSRVDIVDATRMSLDSYFRTAAEAARRAVLKCAPLELPVEQYEIWKEIRFNFDPSKMLS